MKTSTILIAAGAALVAVKLLGKHANVVSRTPTATASPTPQAAQGIGGQFSGVANNIGGVLGRFASLFDSTASGADAPRNIGSNASGLYPSPLLFDSPSLGDYTLAAPWATPPTGFYDQPGPNDFQLQDTGLWASSSTFGGAPAPNYSGADSVFGNMDFTLQ